VQTAATLLRDNQSVAELRPEAIAAGESLLEMEAAMRELESDGVSVLCSLELTRRVFDEELGDKSGEDEYLSETEKVLAR